MSSLVTLGMERMLMVPLFDTKDFFGTFELILFHLNVRLSHALAEHVNTAWDGAVIFKSVGWVIISGAEVSDARSSKQKPFLTLVL